MIAHALAKRFHRSQSGFLHLLIGFLFLVILVALAVVINAGEVVDNKLLAQRAADADGYNRGIEANDLMKEWHVFMLPQKKNRCGHELRCEVVSAMDVTKQKPGHGWAR